MSKPALDWAFRLDHLTPPEKLVLVALAKMSNTEGASWPSQATLAEMTGYSRRRVQQILRSLIRHGCVEVIARTAERGRQTSNYYLLTMGRPPLGKPCAQPVDIGDGDGPEISSPSTDAGTNQGSPLESNEVEPVTTGTECIDIGRAVDNKVAPSTAPLASAPPGARGNRSAGEQVDRAAGRRYLQALRLRLAQKKEDA